MAGRRTRSKRNRLRSLYRPFRRGTAPGAPSGTISPSADAAPSIIRVIGFSRERYERHDNVPVDRIHELVLRDGITWVDVDGVGDADAVTKIGRLFGLHPLALEDVVNVHQRAKVETFQHHLFCVSRMIYAKEKQLESEQVAMFLGSNFVVTFQERLGDCLDPVRRRLTHVDSRLRASSADHLAYAILDAIYDGYFPVLETFGNELDALEDRLEAGEVDGLVQLLHKIRSELLLIRRSLWPAREAISILLRETSSHVSEETRLYLRDVYDHIVQLIDVTETYRELCADLRDLYYAQVSQRTNEVMRLLTIIATLFMPLSFVAGLYGMNFNTEVSRFNMPELNHPYGYPVVVGIMLTIAGGMLGYFYRRGWLRRTS